MNHRDDDSYEQLQRGTIISVLVLLIVLVLLSFVGWMGMTAEVKRKIANPLTTSVTPTEKLGQAATSTTAVTPTVKPGQESASTEAITATATVTPTVTPTATKAETPTVSQEAAMFAARQHFVTLAVLTATMVLFPWVLLLAFAYQLAPHLYKDLEKDLEALGLYRGLDLYRAPKKIRSDLEGKSVLEKELTEKFRKKILEGFTQEYQAKTSKEALSERASRLAEVVASKALGKGTGAGDPPPELTPTVWEEVDNEALEINKHLAFKEAKKAVGLEQRFGWVEFLLPLLSMTPIVLVSFIWAFWPQSMFGFVNLMVGADHQASLNAYFGEVVVKMAPAAVAVITAYLFMMFGLVRRYHRSDITPGSYWEVLNRLIVVFLLGLVGSVLLWTDGNIYTRTTAIALGILAGVFPVDALRFFVKTVVSRIQKWLAGNNRQMDVDLAERLQQRHPLYWLDDLDQWDELRLTEEGIIGIQGMANADLLQLLIWTPFSTPQIVDWVDQAILFLAASAEPDTQYVRTFRKMGLRGASDLIDATEDEAGKRNVIAAAQAVQKAPTKDPMILAQLAALRVQLKVKEVQERVSQVKDKKKDDSLDGTTKTNITSAVSAVRDGKELIDSAVMRVKAGSETPAAAPDAANSLQAKFQTASEKANDVEKALKSAQDKVTEDLATALTALGGVFTGDSDANSQAQALVDALDKIVKPLAQAETKAQVFAEKSKAIQKKAESMPTDVPDEVGEAENLFHSLTGLAQNAQKRIKADSTPADAVGSVNDLIKLLTDESADKPKKLLEELKKKDQWTAAGDGNKAKSYGNAEKLVSQAVEILKQAQAAAKVVEDAESAATGMGAWPPLTMEVLVTLLKGLERNANLRRIQRYLTREVAEVPSAEDYISNTEWLQTTSLRRNSGMKRRGTGS